MDASDHLRNAVLYALVGNPLSIAVAYVAIGVNLKDCDGSTLEFWIAPQPTLVACSYCRCFETNVATDDVLV